MTIETLKQLGIVNPKPTPTILEMHDISTIKSKGVVEDPVVSVDSWKYPTYFFVLHPNSQLVGHPLILGRPWLATTDAYISCRSGSMPISDGSTIKNMNLYTLAKPILDAKTSLWMDLEEEEDIQPLLTIGRALTFKIETEDDTICNFISEPTSVTKRSY